VGEFVTDVITRCAEDRAVIATGMLEQLLVDSRSEGIVYAPDTRGSPATLPYSSTATETPLDAVSAAQPTKSCFRETCHELFPDPNTDFENVLIVVVGPRP
jgi:hypothetical protein